jgi:hypothetical protein
VHFTIENISTGQTGLFMPILPTLGRLKQEDCRFEASLSYTVRSVSKKQMRRRRRKRKRRRRKSRRKEEEEEEEEGSNNRMSWPIKAH